MIVLFGSGGQVGWELRRSLAPLDALHPLTSKDPGGNLGDPGAVADTIRRLRPAAVVNASAHTAVDAAESEPESTRARVLNTDAPAAMAAACQDCGALLVHYSTDYVFDGSGDRPWTEDDPTGPLGVYGRTKRDGETAALACDALVFRTSWVYAARGKNFARTMLRLAGERDRLTVVSDQTGAPTGAELIADATAHSTTSSRRGKPRGTASPNLSSNAPARPESPSAPPGSIRCR